LADINKEKNISRTISVLVIVIMFLVVTVVGLTVALFTNRDDDGKIGINVTSGECKIDIVDLGGKTLVGDVLNFVTPDNREKIYFEPGSTYYTEGFKISNIGKIPVNFRVYVSEDAQANRYSIEEAFDLWITNDLTTLKTAERLPEFMGKLSVDQKSETYYLVVKMKEEAGNKFQKQTYTGIGVTVYAVQGNVNIGDVTNG
jgi:hypothetical protein